MKTQLTLNKPILTAPAMLTFQGGVLKMSAGVAVIGVVVLRAIDSLTEGKGHATRLLVKTAALAAVCACVFLVFGTQVGTVAHAVEQLQAGFGSCAGLPMKAGPPPF